jgi:uncharacterized protein YndB with AHSA1/START domain
VLVRASRELLAPLEDVWAFVSEPYNLPNWWPKLGGVEPDRRGLAEGARWLLTAQAAPTLTKKGAATAHLLVTGVEPPRRFAFRLLEEKLDAELTLAPLPNDRTHATLDVRSRWLFGPGRSLARDALSRLHALCQTGAEG